jgi:hypothetical protein
VSDNPIPTPEQAASAHNRLQRAHPTHPDQLTPGELAAALDIALPFLAAAASGLIGMAWRPFCDVCDGDGFFEQGDDRTGETESEFCKPCKGTGLEPDPPGRPPARTAYDAMIEAAAEGGA